MQFITKSVGQLIRGYLNLIKVSNSVHWEYNGIKTW